MRHQKLRTAVGMVVKAVGKGMVERKSRGLVRAIVETLRPSLLVAQRKRPLELVHHIASARIVLLHEMVKTGLPTRVIRTARRVKTRRVSMRLGNSQRLGRQSRKLRNRQLDQQPYLRVLAPHRVAP